MSDNNNAKRITSPKQFDEMVKVHGKWMWISLFALAALMAFMVLFTFTQTMEEKITRYGVKLTLPFDDFMDDNAGDREKQTMTGDYLESYILLDNLTPASEYTVLVLFVPERAAKGGAFSMGTRVRAGKAEGVIIMTSGGNLMTYDEIYDFFDGSDAVMKELELYPGQSYCGLIVASDAIFKHDFAERNAANNSPTEDELDEMLQMLAEHTEMKLAESQHWLDDVPIYETEDGVELVNCEIILQSAKISSFLLKN